MQGWYASWKPADVKEAHGTARHGTATARGAGSHGMRVGATPPSTRRAAPVVADACSEAA
ncbi:hypothetical protein GCM10012287_03230 [Streptomyces daqingensis]|uniref:Uncharacterized protein n=1 Tax=Streptomyces daqingensis TaxID=1472640 RepID=A0ABQ2LT52_9ACTN|nr:hypothetical protein GCM10012287_03230 [Streptomyces daqingensis]